MKPRTIEEWATHLRTISVRVRDASGRVKVGTQDTAARQAQTVHASDAPANPIYILAAITLGIPALALMAFVEMNPSIREGTFMTVVTFLVVSAFVVAAAFEIKRLADQSSGPGHH